VTVATDSIATASVTAAVVSTGNAVRVIMLEAITIASVAWTVAEGVVIAGASKLVATA
jgi:hypothetical protein